MEVDNWENKPESLLYLLLIEKRFAKETGGLSLLYSESKIIALSGYYKSDFNSEIFVIGVRSWVLKEHRFQLLIANEILPEQIEQVNKHGGKTAIITFNESNKAFAKLIDRTNKNLNSKIKFFFGKNYPEIFRDVIVWPNPVRIKNVKQWIIIKHLRPSTFDWDSIAWNE